MLFSVDFVFRRVSLSLIKMIFLMGATFRFILFYLFVQLTLSCSESEEVRTVDDVSSFSGIELTTGRNSNNYNGIGVTCNSTDLLPFLQSETIIYAVIAGDSLDLEDVIHSESPVFQLLWIEQEGDIEGEEISGFGLQIKDYDQDGIDGDLAIANDITIELIDLTEERMIGSFSASFKSRSGEEEIISGRFNVERSQCTL